MFLLKTEYPFCCCCHLILALLLLPPSLQTGCAAQLPSTVPLCSFQYCAPSCTQKETWPWPRSCILARAYGLTLCCFLLFFLKSSLGHEKFLERIIVTQLKWAPFSLLSNCELVTISNRHLHFLGSRKLEWSN